MPTTPATLLIVDDDEGIRKLLEIMLEDQGYQTLSAPSGEMALAMVARQPPDLILLDAMMPGMDGYQVARHIKANVATANIPIIMLSGLSEQSARLSGLEAGAEEVLSKPVVNDELWLKVRNLLRLKAFGDHQAGLARADDHCLARDFSGIFKGRVVEAAQHQCVDVVLGAVAGYVHDGRVGQRFIRAVFEMRGAGRHGQRQHFNAGRRQFDGVQQFTDRRIEGGAANRV